MKAEHNIVVLANGLFPAGNQGQEILKAAEKIICCDGAADKLIEFGLLPNVIIGDLDSLSPEVRLRHDSILIYDDDQESNDMTKAVRYCIKMGYSGITILGATGLREDHTLGNISLMLEYYPGIKVNMVSDFGMFFLINSGEQVKTFPGEKISIFSVNNEVCVNASGLKYPLNDMKLSNWYVASLNEATGNSFSLTFESELPLIVYKAW